MKKYDFFIENENYILEINISNNDSLIIKAGKDNNNISNAYEKEYSLKEIYKLNEKYKQTKNKDDLIDLIYNDFFLIKEKEIKFEGYYLIFNNKMLNTEIKLEKIYQSENDIIDDIFKQLTSLENQVNQFTQSGQNLTNNLQNKMNQIENIISSNKK